MKRGAAGEELAQCFLRCRGLKILERNWRSRGGELDIVCAEGRTLVFVEVKTRHDSQRGVPGEALTPAKRKRLLVAAGRYLTARGLWDRPCRFDLVAVHLRRESCVIEHQTDVIDASDSLGGGHAYWQPW